MIEIWDKDKYEASAIDFAELAEDVMGNDE